MKTVQPINKDRRPLQVVADLLIYGKRWSVRDDDGNVFRLFEPDLSTLTDNPAHGVMSRQQYRSLQRTIRAGRSSNQFLYLFAILCIALGGYMLIRDAIRIVMPATAGPSWDTLLWHAFVTGFGLAGIRSLGTDRQAISTALRNDNRCASCAYALTGLRTESDGKITCPECTARWNAPKTHE